MAVQWSATIIATDTEERTDIGFGANPGRVEGRPIIALIENRYPPSTLHESVQ